MNDQDPSRFAGNQLYVPLPPIEYLPELTGFLTADVSASPEAQQKSGGATAGEMEYARTLVAIDVYDRLYGDATQDADPTKLADDYAWVVEAQHIGKGEDRRLRPGHLTSEEFLMRRQELRAAFPDQESWDAARYVTSIHDIMKKDENMRVVGLVPGVDSHDEGLPRLFLPEYAEARARILPTYADPNQFTDRQRHIIEGASTVRGVNWPGVMQSQAPAVVLENIPQSLDHQTLEAFIVHAEADIAGAAGHSNPNGSLTLDSPTFTRMRLLRQAVRQGGTSLEINDAFLMGCASELYGVDVQSVSDSLTLGRVKAMTRIANTIRTPHAEKYNAIVQAFDSRSEHVREVISAVYNRTGIYDRAPNLEFLPALMLGIEESHGLEIMIDYLAHVLTQVERADQSARDRGETTGSFEVNLELLAKTAQKGELDPSAPIRFTSYSGILISES
jgi:hypothetical protein